MFPEELGEKVIALRRAFHEEPELSGEEVKTSRRIQAQLTEWGIPFETGFAKTGVLGIVKGAHPGPTVALRADIDALPITEEVDVPFRSKVHGVMHACGHDGHTAMLLGCGKWLFDMREELAGTVLLIFQPAEEFSPNGGARPMMEDGLFRDYKPDCILGQHVWPQLPVGTIGVRPGPMMGASDRFHVWIEGEQGHASMPHQTTDAVIILTAVVSQLQTIVSRNVDPLASGVLTVGKVTAGDRYNVVAGKAYFEGTIRTFDEDVKNLMKKRFFSIVENTVASHGGRCKIEYIDGYGPTVNDAKWAHVVQDEATKVLGEDGTPAVAPSLGGEDFSRFLEKYPGAFYWLGTAIPGRDTQRPLHDSKFELDERALPIGAHLLGKLALRTLTELRSKEGDES
ncbi:M20 metallopeptidase family protein [Bacillus fonticola]|uniref:M20 metallopeptidase family protein n=1 Tax=Bacillus fonticola TaxID=2728853 RepID=UPI00147279B4|nr:M20 family metallopeptidase [Bacillus fonticola]